MHWFNQSQHRDYTDFNEQQWTISINRSLKHSLAFKLAFGIFQHIQTCQKMYFAIKTWEKNIKNKKVEIMVKGGVVEVSIADERILHWRGWWWLGDLVTWWLSEAILVQQCNGSRAKLLPYTNFYVEVLTQYRIKLLHVEVLTNVGIKLLHVEVLTIFPDKTSTLTKLIKKIPSPRVLKSPTIKTGFKI